jgi:hypothetical protein
MMGARMNGKGEKERWHQDYITSEAANGLERKKKLSIRILSITILRKT